jgi:periplasmic divalent cation tolerance protein
MTEPQPTSGLSEPGSMGNPRDQMAVVLTTVPTLQQAEELARALVEERLAGCVQILSSVRSFYRWQGKVTEDTEVLLLIKTRRALFAELSARVRDLHSYETPELVLLPARAELEYGKWLDHVTRTQQAHHDLRLREEPSERD